MPVAINIKKFTTGSDVPTTAEIADGETAINTTDKKIYTRVGSSIIEVANAGSSSAQLTVVDDTSTTATLSLDTDSLTVSGGSGVDTSISGDVLTIAGEDASTSNKGVASFSSDNFAVSSGAVTIKDSGVANAELAGSITNAKLSNSSVNYGGITVALGASDTTPAFDLSDATNYPTTSLTGTITNAQLAGSIANSKLSNSSFTLVDTSSTSTTISLGETLKIQGTSNEVDTSVSGDTITIGLPNNVTIAGNLTVSGTTTEVSSTTINVADPLLSLATNNDSADAVDIGLYGLYDTSGSQDLYGGIFRDASNSGKWKLFKDLQAVPTTTVNTSGTGYAVGTLVANLEGDVTGDITGNADTATALATGRTINNVSFDGTANIDIGTVTSGATTITSNLGSMALDSERLDVPVGFITLNIGSTNYKMPYYSA